MEIAMALLLLVVGFIMLVKGADWFVEGAAGIASRFGIPQLVIGLTIVAMGTSTPEAAVSITSALDGNAGITVGNVIGSNILNILIILGVTAAIVNVPVQKSTIFAEIPFMIVVTAVFLWMGANDGKVDFLEGVICWLLFLAYLLYLLVMAKKNKEAQDETANAMNIWLQLLALAGGAVVIVAGSQIAVDSATKIAEFIGVTPRFIGLTVVALGTSLPELVTSVVAARKGKADIAIGNIVGSNIFNILFVAGTAALITPVAFESKFIIDTLLAAGAGILLLLCVAPRRQLTRISGILMLAGYGAYFAYLVMA